MKKKDAAVNEFNFITKLIKIFLYLITIMSLICMLLIVVLNILEPYNTMMNIKYSSKEEFVNKLVEVSQNTDEDELDNYLVISDNQIDNVKNGNISTNDIITTYYATIINLTIESVFAVIIIICFIDILNKTDFINEPFNNKTLKLFSRSFSLIFIKYIVYFILSSFIGNDIVYSNYVNEIFVMYNVIEFICFYGFILLYYAKKLKNSKNFEE